MVGKIKKEFCTNDPDTDAACVTSNKDSLAINNNFLVTLTNQQRFLDDHYADSHILDEAKLEWFEVPNIP